MDFINSFFPLNAKQLSWIVIGIFVLVAIEFISFLWRKRK